MPGARLCVPCLVQAGDVPVIKRFDEYLPDGEKVETFFLGNPIIIRAIRHSNISVPSDDDFYIAVGDDSHLTVEIGSSIDVAHPLSSMFEDDGDPFWGMYSNAAA